MKTHTSLLLIAVIFLLALAGCSNASNNQEKEDGAQQLTYSNLTDVTSRDEVKKAMAYAGITADNINSFFRGVDHFNRTIGEEGLTEKGFTTIDSLEPEYDSLAMLDMWNAENPEFIGYNCRITSYDLMKDSISIGEPNIEHAD